MLFRKLEIHRAANGKPLIHPDDPHVVAVASDVALPNVGIPVIDLNDVKIICDCLLKHAVSASGGRRYARAMMAQLTDDCFAFSGPLLRLEEMKRLISDRISPVGETEFVPLHWCMWPRDGCRPESTGEFAAIR